MESYYLEATPKTPKLDFNPDAETFLISGRSIPENSIEFYKPLLDWLDKYVSNPLDSTIFEIKLEYFNTSSSKCLVEIFRKLEKIHENGSKVSVEWYFDEEDEDMEESGEDFKEIIKIPFNMKEIKED
ncbi:hypothetical protein MATR_21750 [Marivirga tractuosa]|uniref:SiaC family regulatory phosphoprotein domain-containing protein n=1 Tax=Marivirga tractuosa (strain ATCC 23168 / DSM 4126 / NBRC 15989 / NCIMB 1408 / VKM B-1430 / H-43) TaxID=643867 RepID=E4TL71_MARTH|nr:DUF1987 domain-containing protein [Marivirga tractuosa]ADR20209.1 Domain of unknown function DUF1987 [Marivirga tractuosa DSM 4126]BDD15350.1 hypothetical protein MATR_21750 [Marivirga tractuosa]